MEAVTLADRSALYYFDSQTVSVSRPITAIEAWTIMTQQTGLAMRLAFKVRDAISALFGIRRIGGFSRAQTDHVVAGDHLDFFFVERIETDLLVLTVRDSHLDVMICVMTDGRTVSITASVVTKNVFGRLYMLPVGPAHRLIVHSSLGRLQRSLR